MRKGLLGRKIGMTHVFAEDGTLIPVTVILAGPNYVVQKKTREKDGYVAVQLGFGVQKERRLTRPLLGHLKKAGVPPVRYLREIRDVDLDRYEVGQTVDVDIFAPGELVDVTGTSKGKGTQGPIKRHGFARGRMSHGSGFHRTHGSIGAVGPYRVLKGMPHMGRMGNERVTAQNLEIVRVIPEEHVLLVRGSVPGPRGGLVIIRNAARKLIRA
ncbi:MAG: LSU ribosomal protein L3p (L3e) [Brockia lithotrophica]|uniref:Large ribosomal subunit protein uL3 n=1 Tax=Brockia lithotrophica TaxID=933949 RepID=A0A2T5G4Z1_9BACL|nr:50S ribosomal protein L3 [Brockia lithotrophica]MBT9253547.1 50S ribosomal protein L3 [Brockia lithotrophica]PTQ51249.1 MAG: LSU ribosomal protein L3p (L3e) [Brockia lithotrophica]